MVKFLEKVKMDTLNDRVQDPAPQRIKTRQGKQEREGVLLDSVAVEYGNVKKTEAHLCAAEVGSTNHCLTRTVKRRELRRRP